MALDLVNKIKYSFIFILLANGCFAQSIDSLSLKMKGSANLDLIDSISIFALIDSVVQLTETFGSGSTLVTRFGYNSNVASANQVLGLSQFGLSPGISYYHKSGLYLDATTYWSQEYSPSLYLTVGSAGYLKTLKKWTFNLEYSRYFYSFSDSAYNSPYTNTVGISNFIDVKPFLFRLDYYHYFGEKNANRIMPSVMLNLEKRNWLGLSRVLLYPTFSVLIGNESWQNDQYIPYTTKLSEIIARIDRHQPLYYLKTDHENKAGFLNYSISLPLSLSLKNYTFQLSYTYNFVQQLAGEPINLNNNGYLSLAFIRYFNFKSHGGLIDFYKLLK